MSGRIEVLAEDARDVQWWWARTLGGARPGDSRDGALHHCLGPIRDRMDIEPLNGEAGEDWRYVRDPSDAPRVEGDRLVYIFRYQSEA